MLSLAVAAALTLTACWDDELAQERTSGGGLVEARSGSALAGFINVKRRNGSVRLFVNVINAPPGEHAVRLHQAGDCSSDDASSAGSVWSLDGSTLGESSLLGDLGNLKVDENGRGLLAFTSTGWGFGDGSELDVVGRALVIHDTSSDLLAAGGSADTRLGCGVIR